MKKILLLLFTSFVSISTFALPLEKLKLPAGFKIQVYANVDDAREIAIGDQDILYVGSSGTGKVYAVIPPKNKNEFAQTLTLATGLNEPNGVAYYRGDLYVAEIHRVLKFSNIMNHLKDPKFTVVGDPLPTKSHHGMRYLRFSPDGWLYLSIGSPCNVCENENVFGTIIRMKPDGTQREIFASGIRNSVGFDWSPEDQTLWFTDNGRDYLGDDLPPDELNHATKPKMNFGFPYYYGKNIPDPEFGSKKSSANMTPSAFDFNAHVAALGMSFYNGNILVAQHGSWNRSKKSGYQVAEVTVRNQQATDAKPFITGWLQGESNWGRPVDIKILNPNTIFISDDQAGVIYKVTRQ